MNVSTCDGYMHVSNVYDKIIKIAFINTLLEL